ncbi:retrovirus-related pol polyprotein from transposon TNT 1-94 [Tanacetum coccineum]
MVLEKKVNTKPIDYVELNRSSKDFGKRFVPQRKLSNEQALHPIIDHSASSPVKIEAPRELPNVGLVNTSLKNLKYHLSQFDNVVKKRITPNALTEGEWGFDHTKAIFQNEIIPFLKGLKDIFNVFDKDLLNEITEVQTVFNRMEAVVQQYHVDKQSELQANNTIIKKLKAHIKRVNETSTSESVKKDLDEIEAINIELEHMVTKLIAKNEHLKQMYKQLYDSIKPSRVCTKEQIEYLVNQGNQKSVEMSDLNAQLQEKVVVITALKNDLRKFKGKEIADNAVQMSKAATIAPRMYKLDPVILAPKVKNNREAHEYYLKHTMEQDAILIEAVEQAKSRNPLDRVKISTSASRLKPSGNTKNDRILRPPSSNEKNKVEVYSGKVKSKLNKQNSDSKNVCNEHVKHPVKVLRLFVLKEWKPTGKVFTKMRYQWKPTRRTFTLVGNACPLTRITETNKVPLRVPIPLEVVAPEHVVTRVYTRRPKVPKCVPNSKPKVVQIILWYLDSGCSKHMTGDRSQLTNFIHKFLGTVKFGNDHVAKIMRYGDYQIENVTISRVYYVEGLGRNLFSVGQFCDLDLEVAFRKHTCFVCNLKGVDLLLGSRGTNLYSLSTGDMMVSSPICLLSKATKTKSWLWHRRLSHLNFGAINHLAIHDLVRGLPRLKFEKDHLCSACAIGKSKKQSHKPKFENTNQEKLYLLHMDLCGPMRVASVNEKKYILIIVDDYSWFTWVKFLASKDEAPDFIIKFLKMIQVRLNAAVRSIRTDNETEYVNQTLRDYYEQFGISHETSVARTQQQNGVVERRNHTLVEVARTMLFYAKAPLFLWTEAVATACFFNSDSLLLTPLCCDVIHDVTPRVSALAGCDILVSEPVMSPSASASGAKFHWGISFATGRKRFTDPETKLRMKHTNHRVRIPKGLYPCRIEEKLTKKQVGGKWILVREMTMISKDGEISEFPEYHSLREEEPTEQPRALNKYGFVDHPKL